MPRDQIKRRYWRSDTTRVRSIVAQIADAQTPVQALGHADRQPPEPPVNAALARVGPANGHKTHQPKEPR